MSWEKLGEVAPRALRGAREQAHCHFSPALIANLEKHWDAANRKG